MAGRSLRLARSPLAPKITIAQGGAVGMGGSFTFSLSALHLSGRFDLLRVGALDRVPAELVAEAGGEAGREVHRVAAGESGEQGGRDHRHRGVRFHGGLDRPAPLATILDV